MTNRTSTNYGHRPSTWAAWSPSPTSGCTITGEHCEQCGSTDPEDLTTGDQGYTACCNELVTDAATCRDHHGEG